MIQRFTAAAVLTLSLAAAPALGQIVPALGPRVVIQELPANVQISPDVAFSPAGSYLAVWTGPDGNQSTQVFGRLLKASGDPSGDRFQISSSGFPAMPRVAASRAGFAVAWIDLGVAFRRYDFQGRPLSDVIRIDPLEYVTGCDVAINDAGDVLVVWTPNQPQLFAGSRVFARRVSSDGALGDVKPLTPDGATFPTLVRAAAAPDGGFLALWSQIGEPFSTVQAQKVNAAGNWSPPFQVNQVNYPIQLGSRPLFRPDGSFSILWSFLPLTNPVVYTTVERQFSAAGTPLTDETILGRFDLSSFDAALDPGGNTLLFSADYGIGAKGWVFDRSWHLLTPVTFLAPENSGPQRQPAVAADSEGAFLALWTLAPNALDPAGTPSAILGRRLDAIPCIQGSAVLCLGPNGRFQARVAWKNPFDGTTGTGYALPIVTDDSGGAFWFFDDQNLELLVKVLDGSKVNGNFWVYLGGLSNVEYTLTVTDTLTGAQRSYHNPPFNFGSQGDDNAFPATPGPQAPAENADNANPGGAAGRPATVQAAASCSLYADPWGLCLGGGQFTVTVNFVDPRSGLAGRGPAAQLTGDTGAFYFFGLQSLQLMIKVLDGRAVNGKFWVFYGALSDLDYTITVTRLESGEVRTYHNPRGTLASHADTQAF